MMNNNDCGRWLSLFGRPTTFAEDAKKAKAISSTFQLFGKTSDGDYQYIKIVCDEIDGWEVPLWGSDGEWLYLRRPQGVWKTRLPAECEGRTGLVGQRRRGGADSIGELRIRAKSWNDPAWHFWDKKVEPEEMDGFYGPPVDGYEIASLVDSCVFSDEARIVMDGGDVFGEPPKKCVYAQGCILLEGHNGRRVMLPVAAAYDLETPVRLGKLWLRFGADSRCWMVPFDSQVISREV